MTNANPTLTICERQLELLGELAEMTIVVARSYAHAAVAAAAAVEAVVADEYYQSETERARALAGAKDAAGRLPEGVPLAASHPRSANVGRGGYA